MTVIDLNAARGEVEILQWVKSRQAELKLLEDNAKAKIQEILGDGGDTGTLDGEVVVTWSNFKESRLDTKAFREAHPELAAEYTHTNAKRRFEVK